MVGKKERVAARLYRAPWAYHVVEQLQAVLTYAFAARLIRSRENLMQHIVTYLSYDKSKYRHKNVVTQYEF